MTRCHEWLAAANGIRFPNESDEYRRARDALLAAWDGEWADVEQRISLVVVARSPIERPAAFKKERGWRHLRIYSDSSGEYTRDYVSTEDADMPAFWLARADAVVPGMGGELRRAVRSRHPRIVLKGASKRGGRSRLPRQSRAIRHRIIAPITAA